MQYGEGIVKKVGFLLFHDGLFTQLTNIAIEHEISSQEITSAILRVMKFQNEILEIPSETDSFEINIVDFNVFEDLYTSIHHEIPAEIIPLFLVAGAINLKDPEVPGYVSFSLPRDYLNDSLQNYNFAELLINAAHERFERYLHTRTILAKIYESARADYHESYTLDKQKNMVAFILYALHENLIPLHETITYAMSYFIEDYILQNTPKLLRIPLPLIDREFFHQERKATKNFIQTQLKGAIIDRVNSETAYKRIITGLHILQDVSDEFKNICDSFLEEYPRMKTEYEDPLYNFSQVISESIQNVFQKHNVSEIMQRFKGELAEDY